MAFLCFNVEQDKNRKQSTQNSRYMIWSIYVVAVYLHTKTSKNKINEYHEENLYVV